ncbi:thiol-disulfide oxidoreductase DCC family protein [Rossellomorea aquimaris]|uniref:thiol-disulfide oxidoreductase DCC family protein n=1 Tax=Rossellomorea aquimaris TaxID=189382 RepID=UPI001CD7552B|nr:thiol-disulfide oxidoreductase DCC family protein [Rossellomorea aquimaris]MCA1054432.1 thiol-disulfide oxidoreductase DCC family protein [Rossellomorea aquimaris]
MSIILFDGVCNLCSHAVQFIIERDPKGNFRFASLQSNAGERLRREHGIQASTDSIVLIKDGRAYVESTAALRVASGLKWPWKAFTVMLVIPRPIRDRLYQWVAKNRYKWFGKKDSCMMPSKETKDRFIEL